MVDSRKQQIIALLSEEIFAALTSCEFHRHESIENADKTEALINSYTLRVERLRTIREQLENEFTVIHYDPR